MHDAPKLPTPRDQARDEAAALRGTLELADWRRRIAELYAEVRATAEDDPERAHDVWRTTREALYRTHPQSPLPATERDSFRARHFPYDPRWRLGPVPVRADGAETEQPAAGARPLSALALPDSGTESRQARRIGSVEFEVERRPCRLAVFWLTDYAGGLFLPFVDATSGTETYGAGRYLLDAAKGADLGGDPEAGTIVVDFNFAYQPSCAFDPRWSCPLAPPGNRIDVAIRAGERMR